MPVYTIQLPDGRTMRAEAPDEAAALRGAQEWFAANPAQPGGTAPTPQQPAAPASGTPGSVLQRLQTAPPPTTDNAPGLHGGVSLAPGMVSDPWTGIQPQGDGWHAEPQGRSPFDWAPAFGQGVANGATLSQEPAISAIGSAIGDLFRGNLNFNDAYHDRLAPQLAERDQLRAEQPLAFGLGEVGGALGMGAAAAPLAIGRGGMLAQSLRGGGAGFIAGATSAAGEHGRAAAGPMAAGAGLGLLGGAVAPWLAAGAGKLGASLFGPQGASQAARAAGTTPLAARTVADTVQGSHFARNLPARPTAADVQAVQGNMLRRASDFGDMGTLGDMAPDLQDLLATTVSKAPPAARNRIAHEYGQRTAYAGQRGRQAITRATGQGPVQQPVYAARLEAEEATAGPLFRAFHGSQVPETPQLASIWQHIQTETPDLVDAARMLWRNPVSGNYSPRTPFIRAGDDRLPTAEEWDFLARAAQDEGYLTKVLGPKPSGEAAAGARVLANRIQAAVDDAISPGNAAASPWARGRQIVSNVEGDREAFQAGMAALGGGPPYLARNIADPDAIAAWMRTATPRQVAAQRSGLIRQLENLQQQAGNDVAALEAVIRPLWDRRILQAVLGKDEARRIVDHVLPGVTMRETGQMVARASRGGSRAAARAVTTPREIGPNYGLNPIGAAARLPSRIAVAISRANMPGFSAEVARLLSVPGAQRNDVIRLVGQTISEAVARREISGEVGTQMLRLLMGANTAGVQQLPPPRAGIGGQSAIALGAPGR